MVTVTSFRRAPTVRLFLAHFTRIVSVFLNVHDTFRTNNKSHGTTSNLNFESFENTQERTPYEQYLLKIGKRLMPKTALEEDFSNDSFLSSPRRKKHFKCYHWQPQSKCFNTSEHASCHFHKIQLLPLEKKLSARLFIKAFLIALC